MLTLFAPLIPKSHYSGSPWHSLRARPALSADNFQRLIASHSDSRKSPRERALVSNCRLAIPAPGPSSLVASPTLH